MDYVLFVYALGLAFLAAMLLGLSSTVSSSLPWRWLGMSAAALAVSSTADLLRLAFTGPAADLVQTGFYVAGCLLLLEFARRCWEAAGGRRFGLWVVVVLAIVSGLGLLAGVRGLEAAASYFLGALGGLWGAAAILRAARRSDPHGRPLTVAAVCMVGFVLAEFGVPLWASLPPAEWVNRPWFLDTFGFPVELVAMGFAAPFVAALWYYYRTLLKEEHPGLVDRKGLALEAVVALVMVVLIAGGLYATTLAGRHADADARRNLLGRAQLAAGGIDPNAVASQTATPADLGTKDYKRLRQQLMLMTTASADIRRLYLLTEKDGAILFTVDGLPAYDSGHAGPGTPDGDHPSTLPPVFRTGRAIVVGPYRDEHGTLISAFAPVREPYSGRVLGVLGVDINASDRAATVAEQRLQPLLITLLLALMVIGFYVVQERRRVDALTLAESEREYRSVLESMGDVFYRSDRDGRLTMASPSFARVMGYDSVDDAIGLDLAQEFYEHPSQRGALLERIERDGSVTDFEVTVRRRDGTIVDGAITGNFYRDPTGEVQGVEGVLRDMTARKRAEAALVEAEERARHLLESVGEGILGVDHQGQVIFMNPVAEEMLGWTAADLHGIRIHDAIHYAYEDGRAYPVDQCPQRGAYEDGLECRVDGEVLWRRDGTCFPVEYIARPLMSGDAVTGAIISFRDISERRAAEEALRESRERLDFVLLAAEVGTWEWEIDPDVIEWDDMVTTLYGLPDDLRSGPWSVFDAHIHPNDVDVVDAAATLAIETDASYEVEFRVVHADGSVAYLAERGRVRRDEAGEAVTLSGVTWDITERRRVEEELRFTTFVVEHAADTVFWMAADGSLLYGNRTARESLGYSAEEFSSLMVHDIDADFPIERWPEHIAELRETGSMTFESRHRRRDGTIVPVEVTAMYFEFGGEAFDVAFCRDISERRAAEDALRRAKEQTDAANRDLQVAIARANQLAVEAESANAAKSEFLANMSHEIRTPMNGVIGMTALLMDTDLDAEQRDYAQTVNNSADALLTIINDILDFSKIEAGRLEMEVLDFDLRTTVEDTCDLPALQAQAKGLELIALVEPDVPSALRGDPGRLRQVLTNLLGNAVKFTEHGEITVTVGLVEETDDRATLRFSVRDTGIGINPGKADGLFEAFTQADASTTRRFGGTGLGLAISKRLVELMGGGIGVDSELGAGSTFWFTATLSRQDPSSFVAPEDLDTDRITGARILAVDDNETNRKVVAGMLETWGCRHDEVDSAAVALDVLHAAVEQGEPYDVAVLDMMMPETDGEALGRLIKADSDIAGVHLVMMTSMGSRGDAGRLERLGFAAYLTKPVKQSQLFDCLMVVMHRGESDEAEAVRIVTRHSLADRDKRKARILLAEDNAINRKVALKTLERMGYRAESVEDGHAAVEALSQRRFDLVLMDVQMPVMDGITATKRIRDEASPVLDHRVPIVALTAHAMAEDREVCLAAGMNDYLSKPIQPDKLAAVLERWMRRHEGQEEEPSLGETEAVAPVAAASGSAVFDGNVLLGLLDGDREAADEILKEYLADTPRQLSALRAALAGDDVEAARRHAHSLKGASASVGAEALRAAAYEVERAAAAGDRDAAGGLADRAEEELERLQEHLARREGQS
jgi:PAS domain S-box-containing protein